MTLPYAAPARLWRGVGAMEESEIEINNNKIMGYTTTFDGTFKLDKPLAPEHAHYLREFSETRRMARRPGSELLADDPVRIAACLPVGEEGAYFVGGEGHAGQEIDSSVIDFNNHPSGQPGLWCQWLPTEDGTAIEWDQSEKFYNYVEWLEYIIKHFLQPWGYVLNGTVRWHGEDDADMGQLVVLDNVLDVERGHLLFGAGDERDDYRRELSAVMPEDYKDWWQNSKTEWPKVAALTITNLRERAEQDAKMLEAMVTVDDARLAMLETLWAGCAKVGRWLDAGEEAEPDAEGAEWVPYTPEEQAEWLRDSVVPRLEHLLFKHDGDGNPIISSEILRMHEFDKERHDQTRYPHTN